MWDGEGDPISRLELEITPSGGSNTFFHLVIRDGSNNQISDYAAVAAGQPFDCQNPPNPTFQFGANFGAATLST